jgi:Nucleotidyltransferase domain
MGRVLTLKERKPAETDRRRRAVEDLRSALAAYARQHSGRFLLFGSAARGDMRYNSDVDILVDFPPDALDDAWNFAERACWDRRLDPDITPFSWCKGRFLERVTPDLQVMTRATSAGPTSRPIPLRRWTISPVPSRSIRGPACTTTRWMATPGEWASCMPCSPAIPRWKRPCCAFFSFRGEEGPSGRQWHADLIQRAGRTTLTSGQPSFQPNWSAP